MSEFSYSRLTAEFHPGDLLLAFTDGVFEATGTDGQIFGETRIKDVLSATAGRPADEINQRLIAAVREFSGRDSFEDDVCVVAIEALR